MAEKRNSKRKSYIMEPQDPKTGRDWRQTFSKLKHPSQFSKPQLAIFVLAFAVIGYLIVKTFAAAPLLTSVQGEQMTPQVAAVGSRLSRAAPSRVELASSTSFTNLSLPSLSGSSTVGSTLTVNHGTWNPIPTSYHYAWWRCNSGGCTHFSSTEISTSTTSYTLQSNDVGYSIMVQVAPNGLWTQSKSTAQSPAVTVASTTFTNTTLPTLSGSPTVGSTLMVNQGVWNPTPTSYLYAWFRCNTSGCNHFSTTEISSTNSSYTLLSKDVGYSIMVQVAPNGLWTQSKSTAQTVAVIAPATPSTKILSDAAASNGKEMELLANDSLTSSFSLPSTAASITVMAKADLCSGVGAAMTASVDGTQLINTTVNATSLTAYSANTNLTAGTHTLTISYTNDSSTPTCDRNLYVDATNFYGPNVSPAPTVSLSVSPSSITSGQAATLTWSSTNASSCTANGVWSGSKATSGSISTGALSQTSTYTLTCTGSGGTASASTTVTVTSVTTGQIMGVGTLQWGTNYQYQTNLNKYQLVGLSGGSQKNASVVSGTSLGYELTGGVDRRYWDGVLYTEAQANNWILYCADGSEVYSAPYPDEVQLNPGYASYQTAFVNETINYIKQYNLKGMFFDTFVEDELAFKPKCRSNGASATYPFYNKNKQVVVSDQAAFRAATLSFIKAVGPALKSHAYYVMVNGEGGGPGAGGWDDDGSKTKNWMSAYAPYVSDAAVESFQQASGSPTTFRPTGSSAWWQHWDGWASTEAYVESLGVDFSGIEHLSCTNMLGWRYTRASFLMEWNRYTSTWVAMTNGCNVWNSVTAYNPGLPTGARTQLATGVWQRKFQNGTVVINTNATPVTVSVNSKSYTIGATDALLL